MTALDAENIAAMRRWIAGATSGDDYAIGADELRALLDAAEAMQIIAARYQMTVQEMIEGTLRPPMLSASPLPAAKEPTDG
jgi:hypothetical protein